VFSPRPFPPIQWGSLKGLPAIPSPFCVFHIGRSFEGPESTQEYKEISQRNRGIERRIEKIIRRLLLKAGVPFLSSEQPSKFYNAMMLQVEIDINLLQENLFSYSVRMQLVEEVLLARDPNIKIEAVTWGSCPVTGYCRRHEPYAVEEVVDLIIREHIVKDVRSLASSYLSDNEPDDLKQRESDGRYDTGPLDEN
jgi:hypothetical protein